MALHLTYRRTSYYSAGGLAVAYLFVHDAEQVYAQWVQPGIHGRTQAPADMPWKMHEGITMTRTEGHPVWITAEQPVRDRGWRLAGYSPHE